MQQGLPQIPAPTGAYSGLGGGGFLSQLSPFEKLMGAGAIGGGLGSAIQGLFGGGGDVSGIYQDYLNKAMTALQQHEAQGRGDISGYYQKALGFGEPYRTAGTGALGAYQASLGLGGPGAREKIMQQFQASPGYQFALQQGLQGTQRQMTAAGLGGSGAEEKALERYGQGLAGQEFGQYQQKLAGLAGMGQEEAGRAAQMAYGTGGALAGLGRGYGGDIAGLYGTMGAAQAQAELARQQQQAKGWGGLAQAAGTLGSLAFLM